MFDLLKTIEDDADVPNFSENSDEEDEFQPSKQKKKKNVDFDVDFAFVSSVSEYNVDTWDNLSKYIKRKGKSKVDEKIQNARRSLKKEQNQDEDVGTGNDESLPAAVSDSGDSDEEISLSEDELQRDNIKVKEKVRSKRAKKKQNTGANDIQESEFFEDAPPFDENASFYQMNLSRPLLKAIAAMNFIHPTPIQAATIPVALMGRDVSGCAATGTGKTAAYMLPILERLLYRPLGETAVTRVLVLVPTRELGVQVYQVTRQLAQFTNVEAGLAVGGLDLKAQESVLRRNPDIVIATPGRLIDHLKNTPTFTLDSIEVLVLDEADRMLDENFAEQMKEIVRSCARSRQTLLFSATMTEAVEDLAAISLKKPVKVFVDSNRVVAFNLRQEFVRIRAGHEGDREAVLAALICRTFRDHTMVFVQTKKQAHRIHVLLGLLGIKVGELHGNMSQPQRLEALQKFKDEELDVLVATDVAARGLDIRGVKTVINFVMPATVEHYIHRVGRTARAGRVGVSVSLAGEGERRIVKDVIKKASQPVKMRIIATDIVEKYRTRVSALEEKVKHILQEEWEERTLNRAENQANRAEKILKGHPEMPRAWFQSDEERKLEKKKLMLSEPDERKRKQVHGSNAKEAKLSKRGKRGGKNKDTPEERAEAEINKVLALKARLAKKKDRPHKIRAVIDHSANNSCKTGSFKRKKSSFAQDLTDVSKKGAKRMRYDANVKQKMDRMNSTKIGTRKAFGESMTGRKNNGKAFGQKKKKKSNKNR